MGYVTDCAGRNGLAPMGSAAKRRSFPQAPQKEVTRTTSATSATYILLGPISSDPKLADFLALSAPSRTEAAPRSWSDLLATRFRHIFLFVQSVTCRCVTTLSRTRR